MGYFYLFYSKEKLSFMLFDRKIVPNYCLVLYKYLLSTYSDLDIY